MDEYITRGKFIKYEVLEDDGKRLLGTLDLIKEETIRAKDKSRAKRHRQESKTFVKWLKSHLQIYGIMSNPYKSAVLTHYNIVRGREIDKVYEIKKILKKDIDDYPKLNEIKRIVESE